jgi:hypothetical protein
VFRKAASDGVSSRNWRSRIRLKNINYPLSMEPDHNRSTQGTRKGARAIIVFILFEGQARAE